MAVFGFHDIDPLFENLSQDSQETILSLAHGQAGSFIASMQSAAESSLQDKFADQPRPEVAHNADQLDEDAFNVVMAEAHPAILKAVFVMGFTQGFCLRHRLNALDAELYTLIPSPDEEEEEDEDLTPASEENEEVDEPNGNEGTE